MLDDIPRKLLRITAQFKYHLKHIPLSGRWESKRTATEIIRSFKLLALEQYIERQASPLRQP
ncbi:hypothetical protein BK146_05385 [Paenibacillus sp. FSL R7-0333]|nr:hypothetical protein BK146_05385 [Paenibacillus sp. FSL R7-0333]